jgi:hypothetical protein
MMLIIYFRRLLTGARISHLDVGQALVYVQRAEFVTRAQQVDVPVEDFGVYLDRAFT